MADDDGAPEPEAPFDRAIRRVHATIGLVVLVGEVVWLIDTHAGTRPSVLANRIRFERARVKGWWRRISAPGQARQQTPRLLFEVGEYLERRTDDRT